MVNQGAYQTGSVRSPKASTPAKQKFRRTLWCSLAFCRAPSHGLLQRSHFCTLCHSMSERVYSTWRYPTYQEKRRGLRRLSRLFADSCGLWTYIALPGAARTLPEETEEQPRAQMTHMAGRLEGTRFSQGQGWPQQEACKGLVLAFAHKVTAHPSFDKRRPTV